MRQINTIQYWNKKWAERKTGGNYGENQYYFLENYISKDEECTILDLGCGRGNGIKYLANILPKAIFKGMDFSDYAVTVAREKLKEYEPRVAFDCGDVYSFTPQPVDYVLLVAVLEHLRWPEKILDKYIKVAKKAIYISIPITNWYSPEHIYAYGPKLNPFEKWGAELLGNFNGRKKLRIEVKK